MPTVAPKNYSHLQLVTSPLPQLESTEGKTSDKYLQAALEHADTYNKEAFNSVNFTQNNEFNPVPITDFEELEIVYIYEDLAPVPTFYEED